MTLIPQFKSHRQHNRPRRTDTPILFVRRLMATTPRHTGASSSSLRRRPQRGRCAGAANDPAHMTLWVSEDRLAMVAPCPLHPRKRPNCRTALRDAIVGSGCTKFVQIRLEPFVAIEFVFITRLATHGGRPMDASDRFLRFAAECELMAKGSRDPENKTVWRGMAERWARCAELIQRQKHLIGSKRTVHEASWQARARFELRFNFSSRHRSGPAFRK